MLSFNFAGKNSYTDYGLIIAQRPTIQSPIRRVTNLNIPGRNSSLHFDEETYDDISISVECTLVDEKNLINKIDDIKGWLLGAGEQDLEFSFQNDRKYIAQVVNNIDFNQAYRMVGSFVILFNCRPFKYAIYNKSIEVTNNFSLSNTGTIYSEPIIRIEGTGDISFKINSRELKIKELSDHIILNSQLQDCYDDSVNNLNNKVNGELPVLDVGVNILTWAGNVRKVSIIPNWRWL